MTPTLLVVVLLSQAEAPDDPPAGAVQPPTLDSPAERWRYLARLEAAGLALLPQAGVGVEEGFALVEPTLILDGGEEFGVNLDVPVRLRMGHGEADADLVHREDDVDGRVAVQFFNRNLEVAVKGLAVGMGQPGAHYLGSAEMRWRLCGGRLYALVTGGTLLFPEGVGTLKPGAFASVSQGMDNG